MPEEEGQYGLVMPFNVVQSAGGPYEDEAFVAGVYVGEIDACLRLMHTTSAILQWYVSPKLLPQLDLLAMRYGYTMTSEPWEDHPDEWTQVVFEKSGPATGDVAP